MYAKGSTTTSQSRDMIQAKKKKYNKNSNKNRNPDSRYDTLPNSVKIKWVERKTLQKRMLAVTTES